MIPGVGPGSPGDTARSRNQSGMTLVETLMALTLAVMIVVPMLGWAQFTFGEQVRTQQRSTFSNELGLLRTYLHRDVASADNVYVSGEHFVGCSDTSDPGSGEVPNGMAGRSSDAGSGDTDPDDSGVSSPTLLLSVTSSKSLTTYSVAPGSEDGLSLWRSSCDKPGGVVTESVELLTRLDSSVTDVSCETTRSLRQPDGCPRITMWVGSESSHKAAVSAMIRSDWVTEQRGADNADQRTPLVSMSANPTRGERGLNVHFSSAGTVDPNNETLQYLWEFGDSQYSDSANPNHVYSALGTYTAVLTVTNTSGLAASSFLVINVVDQEPQAVISSPADGTSKFRGEPISFSGSSSNDARSSAHQGQIVAYAWDFGDGTFSSQANPTKSYSTVSPAGGFRVALTVTDEDGSQNRTEIRVIIANREPSVSITATPANGPAPLTTTLRANVTDEVSMPANPPLSYLWDFGNSTTSTLAEPAPVTYSSPGTYTVRVTVVDDMGASATDTFAVNVSTTTTVDPPRNLRVVQLNPQPRLTMSFAWDSVAGADAYQLELTCPQCSGPIEWTVTETTATVNIPRANTQYTIRIRARAAATAAWSDWSSTIKAKSDK